VCFEPDAVELYVSGRPACDVNLEAVLTAARERAALHHGSLAGSHQGGRWHATARLPVVSGYA
jgi:hypothetical protein